MFVTKNYFFLRARIDILGAISNREFNITRDILHITLGITLRQFIWATAVKPIESYDIFYEFRITDSLKVTVETGTNFRSINERFT